MKYYLPLICIEYLILVPGAVVVTEKTGAAVVVSFGFNNIAAPAPNKEYKAKWL